MIGMSLSLCISDVLDGRVPEAELERVIAATCFFGEDELEKVIAVYQRTYWTRDPKRGAELARKLYAAGKIDQPRLRGEAPPNVAQGHWAQDERAADRWPRDY